MRFKKLRVGAAASVASPASGFAASGERATAGERSARPAARSLHATGYAASGPGFHVWEEDPREARAWLAELSRCASASDARRLASGPRDPNRRGGPARTG